MVPLVVRSKNYEIRNKNSFYEFIVKMRKIVYILIIAVVLNFLMMSLGRGETPGVNVSGYVPETDLNRNAGEKIINHELEKKPVFKENKYLFFFEKTLGLSDAGQMPADEVHTVYDQAASKLLLWLVLIMVAVILWISLNFLDKIIFQKPHGHKKLRPQQQ